jgi:hypothetical protein|tara:strand:- start:14417 stop:14620 length:204 start_codon:yes stop_codon:yes gene_type:complete
MANHDVLNDVAPVNVLKRPSKPTVGDLRTALAEVNSGDSYTTSRLNSMTKNDMISAARIHELTVDGL